MPGLAPGIHALPCSPVKKDVNGRVKPGHDRVPSRRPFAALAPHLIVVI
jgi:hypothetical protein